VKPLAPVLLAIVVGCSSKPSTPTKAEVDCPFTVGDAVMLVDGQYIDDPVLTVEKIYPETKTVMVSFEYRSSLGKYRKDSYMVKWQDVKPYDLKSVIPEKRK
jgi:hypothetical protein